MKRRHFLPCSEKRLKRGNPAWYKNKNASPELLLKLSVFFEAGKKRRVILSLTAEHFNTLVSKHGRCLFHHASILAAYSFENTSLYLQGQPSEVSRRFRDIYVLTFIWFHTIGFYISFLFQPKGMKSNYSTPISSSRSCQTAICKWEGFFFFLPAWSLQAQHERKEKKRGKKNTNAEQKGGV